MPTHDARAQAHPVSFVYNTESGRVLVDVEQLATYVDALSENQSGTPMGNLATWLWEQRADALRRYAGSKAVGTEFDTGGNEALDVDTPVGEC